MLLLILLLLILLLLFLLFLHRCFLIPIPQHRLPCGHPGLRLQVLCGLSYEAAETEGADILKSLRTRMLQEIQRENETYYSLLREALPPGPAREEAFNPAPRAGGGRQGWSRRRSANRKRRGPGPKADILIPRS